MRKFILKSKKFSGCIYLQYNEAGVLNCVEFDVPDATPLFVAATLDKLELACSINTLPLFADNPNITITEVAPQKQRLNKTKTLPKELEKKPLQSAGQIPAELWKYYEIAVAFHGLFYSNIKKINGRLNNLDSAQFGKWVNPVRLMIEVDGVTIDQLKEVFGYLKENEFWQDKIQSTEKLREKFNILYNQIKSNVSKKANRKVSADYLQRVYNDLQTRQGE